MASLALSQKLFAGAFVFIAEYASGTSDAATKPVYSSNLWLSADNIQSISHDADEFEEKFSTPDPDRGWINQKDVHALADIYRVKLRNMPELVHRLQFGVAAAMVTGTAQTPFANPDRKILAWVKIQQRQQVGTDRSLMDIWCEIRLKADPAIEKKTQEPELELWVLKSTLNSVVIAN